jgi:hypothetical protein
MNWNVFFNNILTGASITAIFWALDKDHAWPPRVLAMGLITIVSLVLAKLAPKDKDF